MEDIIMSEQTKTAEQTVTETIEKDGKFETVPNEVGIVGKSLGFIKRHKIAFGVGAGLTIASGIVIAKRALGNNDADIESTDLIENIGDGLSSTVEAITETVADAVEE
ncbi:UNVERIFIED_CONTAM: hypothetical protein RF648_22385 [Kocuria sp. CPCC 205274]